MFNLIFLIFAFFIFGCASSYIPAKYSVHSNNIHKIYIDRSFTSQERLEIKEAISDWNIALNGNFQFILYDNNFQIDDMLKFVNNKNYIILNIEEKDSLIGDDIKNNKRTLAFSSCPACDTIVVIKNRIPYWKYKGLLLHEIAHTLGAAHSENGLMKPIYDGNIQCIDKDTVKQVATYQGFNINSMRWCEK